MRNFAQKDQGCQSESGIAINK